MAKQKIVIKVPMASGKSRSKAMALVAAVGGIDSVAIDGGKDQVVVVGEGVDSVKLTTDLRKKMGDARLVEVGEDKKDEKKPDPVADAVAAYAYYNQYYYPYPPPPPPPAGVVYDYDPYGYSRPGGTCTIM